MKNLLIIFLTAFVSFTNFSQSDTVSKQDTNTYRILKSDGGELIGKILSQDAREILLLTNDNRKIIIPQHVIEKIILVKSKDFNATGTYIGDDKFATRYFLTTNGLPIKKGEHYVQWNLFGPDFQFGLGNNFGVGIMTSWIGLPMIGTIKKSWQLSENTHFALGGLIGSGTWFFPGFGGALPFGTVSFGSRRTNIAFSGGYGAIWQNGDIAGRSITSVAGMVKVSPKITLIFDSFILLPTPNDIITETYTTQVYNYDTFMYEEKLITQQVNRRKPGFALLTPGVRWHQSEGQAFQIGFTGLYINNNIIPIPIPTVQWYRSI